jgi:hypothetical protein
MPSQDNERSAVFEMPKRDIKLPRSKRAMSEARGKRSGRVLKPSGMGVSGLDDAKPDKTMGLLYP